jgi:hypothetical protein
MTNATVSTIRWNRHLNISSCNERCLLFLLDGLLSSNEHHICQSLIQIQNWIYGCCGLAIDPVLQVITDRRIKLSSCTTTTRFTGTTVKPSITWNIIATVSQRERQNQSRTDSKNQNMYDSYRVDLCHILDTVLMVTPQLAMVQSSHDESNLLHYAATLGNLPIVEVIFRHVS